MTYFTCPVCGYDKLEAPPSNWNICRCCGTEFGYDDARTPHDELRRRWINGGAKWWSPVFSPPPLWSALQQLQNLPDILLSDAQKRLITPDEPISVSKMKFSTSRLVLPNVQDSFSLVPNVLARVQSLLADTPSPQHLICM